MSKKRYISVNPSHQNSFEFILNVPREIGHYSVNSDGENLYDRSMMRFYVPRINKNEVLDLNVGYEDTEKVLEVSTTNKLESVLRWLAHKKLEPVQNSPVDFVCTRGSIQDLLYTPYMICSDDDWRMIASKLNGVVYLARKDSVEKLKKLKNASDELKRTFSWAYKFEQYMTSDTLDGKPDVTSTTHEVEEFNIVVKNKIGPYNLLIKAETDGAKFHPENGDTSCYVEIKTSKEVSDFLSNKFKRKLLRWWAQTMAVGIEDTICGFRDDRGYVRKIEEFEASKMPYMVDKYWSPEVCFNFLHHTLDYLKRNLPNSPDIVYVLEYNPDDSRKKRVKVSEILARNDDDRLIPEWYARALNKSQRY